MQDLARTDPEQDRNRVDLQNHVQKTQFSEKKKHVLFDTKRSDVLKNTQFSDDHTLALSDTESSITHSPYDDVNEVLKAKVLQNISRKFDVSSSHISQSMNLFWGHLCIPVCGQQLCLSKDDEDFKYVI